MHHNLRTSALATFLAASLTAGGCATVVGTVVSPITGGVDLTKRYVERAGRWYAVPFVFLGGAVAGPFVAFYNGVNHDAAIFASWPDYWRDFADVLRPFEMIATH